MARSSQSSTDDTQATEAAPEPEQTPAANPAGLEERVTKLEEQLAKLMLRIEAITGPV